MEGCRLMLMVRGPRSAREERGLTNERAGAGAGWRQVERLPDNAATMASDAPYLRPAPILVGPTDIDKYGDDPQVCETTAPHV